MYSIGIVTYVKRFEKYFKPLIRQIKHFRPDIEVIICVNGEYKEKFNEQYRKEILNFASEYNNLFINIFPEFRSLSKLWNTCLINSSNNKCLLLNDDVTITDELFFNNLEKIINLSNQSFKINGSWSHTFLIKEEINEVGWFDERYLGVGEEDGDFEWRYQNKLQKPFLSMAVSSIINHVEKEDCLKNIKIINSKYSLFNKKFSEFKYKESDDGKNYGIMGKKFLCINETKNQYPNEKFFWLNKEKL